LALFHIAAYSCHCEQRSDEAISAVQIGLVFRTGMIRIFSHNHLSEQQLAFIWLQANWLCLAAVDLIGGANPDCSAAKGAKHTKKWEIIEPRTARTTRKAEDTRQ
jgi:hypothetical protein